jgi:hypothetical protein
MYWFNHIGGVMVIMLAQNIVDCGLVRSSLLTNVK